MRLTLVLATLSLSLLAFHVSVFAQTADPDPAKSLIYKYTTDNKKSVMTTPAGPVEIKVKWNNTVLRREMETKESLKVVETSNVMVRMPKVDITRVYDRVQ